jgi:hypothetical protein
LLGKSLASAIAPQQPVDKPVIAVEEDKEGIDASGKKSKKTKRKKGQMDQQMDLIGMQ